MGLTAFGKAVVPGNWNTRQCATFAESASGYRLRNQTAAELLVSYRKRGRGGNRKRNLENRRGWGGGVGARAQLFGRGPRNIHALTLIGRVSLKAKFKEPQVGQEQSGRPVNT